MSQQVIDVRGYFDEQGNPIVKPKRKVEKVEKVARPKTIVVEKPVTIPVERPKLRRKIDYSPEEEVATSTSYAPKVYLDYTFSPYDFLSRSRTFAPRFAYNDEYAPENFTAVSEVFSPSTSTDNTFAPKYESLKRSVYSPLTRRKTKFAPQVEEKIDFKPRLFDKLLAIFAPEAIIKQKSKVEFQPYNYQYTQTAIIDAYNPEQITTVDKFAPKDESNFKLRIAPVTELFIKTKPSSPMFSTTIYIDLLKNILR